jgi:2-iminoacetate synthase ThiH
MPVKDQKKMYNKYIQQKRPMDRLVTGYLNKQRHSAKNSDGLSADDYYRRLLGAQKAPGMDTAMGTKSATLAKAYAVAVKQYHMMRTENLSEQDALEKVRLSFHGTLWLWFSFSSQHFRARDCRSKNCWPRKTITRKQPVEALPRRCKQPASTK